MKKENDSLHTFTERNQSLLAEFHALKEETNQLRAQEQHWKVDLNDLRAQLHEERETRLALVDETTKELDSLRAEKRNLADNLERSRLALDKKAAEEIEVLKKALEAKDALVDQV